MSIRVNCLCPSFADTAIVKAGFDADKNGEFKGLVDMIGLLRSVLGLFMG